MAFIRYLTFDGTALPLPDSYEVQMNDVEADSGGETEAVLWSSVFVTLVAKKYRFMQFELDMVFDTR